MKYTTQLLIAENLRWLRNSHGYTQLEVSEMLHISRSTYLSLENAKKVPSIDIIVDIAELYHISFHSIMKSDFTRTHTQFEQASSPKDKSAIILDLYSQLSPYAKGALIERALVLLEQEKQVSSFSTNN